MSTFGGLMREYRECSLDRFDGVNLKSTAFFLSHCHQDHMVGLNSSGFAYRLETNIDYKLYCSPVTKNLLLNDARYRHLKPHIVALEVSNKDGTIKHYLDIVDPVSGKKKYSVAVTLLQAGHCPGSVMFLFDGHEGSALYTGDFRLCRSDFANMEALHNGDSPLRLTSMYLDTTFCEPKAAFIPDRQESAVAAIDLTREWLSQGPDRHVHIASKAGIGYEQLYMEMAKAFDMKVHVSAAKYAEYSCLPGSDTWCTTDPATTRIHACKWKEFSGRPGDSPLPCGYENPSGTPICMRTLRVSTMAFVQSVGLEHIAKRRSDTFFQVCYSFHSSYSEIRDILAYLKPARAYPNVIPMGEDMQKIEQRLVGFLQASKHIKQPTPSQEERPLGKLKMRKRKLKEPSLSDSDLDFGDSPIKDAKRSKNHSKDTPNVTASHSPVQDKDGCFQFTCLQDSEEEVEVVDLTMDSQESLHNFTPVQNGSLGEYCSYCSDNENCEEDEKQDENEIDSQKSEVLVDFSESWNKENVRRRQTVREKSSKSFVSDELGGFGTDCWMLDTQSLHLNLDGASDDSEVTAEVKSNEGKCAEKGKKGEGDVKNIGEKINDSEGKKDSVMENGDTEKENEPKEKTENMDIKETESENDILDKVDEILDKDSEIADKNTEAEVNEDDLLKSDDEKGEVEEDNNEDSEEILPLESKDVVDMKNKESEGESIKATESGKKDEADIAEKSDSLEIKESVCESSIELVSEDVSESFQSIIELDTAKENRSKRSRSGSESGDEEPPVKKPSKDLNSSDVIMLDSDDSDLGEDSEMRSASDDDDDEDSYDEEERMLYLAQQQRIVRKMMERKHQQQAGGPIDLTEDDSEDSEEEEEEGLSEVDDSEDEIEAGYESESVDSQEWKTAYQQLKRLRREERRRGGDEDGPVEGDCVIVLDSSDEEGQEEEEEEVEEKGGDKKEVKSEDEEGTKNATDKKKEGKTSEKEKEDKDIAEAKKEGSAQKTNDKDNNDEGNKDEETVEAKKEESAKQIDEKGVGNENAKKTKESQIENSEGGKEVEMETETGGSHKDAEEKEEIETESESKHEKAQESESKEDTEKTDEVVDNENSDIVEESVEDIILDGKDKSSEDTTDKGNESENKAVVDEEGKVTEDELSEDKLLEEDGAEEEAKDELSEDKLLEEDGEEEVAKDELAEKLLEEDCAEEEAKDELLEDKLLEEDGETEVAKDELSEDKLLEDGEAEVAKDEDMTTAEIDEMLKDLDEKEGKTAAKTNADEEGKDSAIEDSEELSEVL